MASTYLSIYLSIYPSIFIYLFIYLSIYIVCVWKVENTYLFPKTGLPPDGANAFPHTAHHCTRVSWVWVSLLTWNLMIRVTHVTLISGALVPHSLPENLWISGTSARTKSSPQTAPLEATRVFNNTKPAMMPNAGTSTNKRIIIIIINS